MVESPISKGKSNYFQTSTIGYKVGKRQGKTPMEILTQKEQQKDWLELLLEVVEQEDSVLFSSSYRV